MNIGDELKNKFDDQPELQVKKQQSLPSAKRNFPSESDDQMPVAKKPAQTLVEPLLATVEASLFENPNM